ncbi:MAG: DUF1573 domain-containing protein [Ekhidna sp.]|uniref:DUF1573 domain-containing protein n=1 Tax=Ekhidna sp. TaxID=2608089 RepID=UPI0032ED8500
MKIAKILLGVIVAAGITSCGNSELESRITKLEGRVAALEGKGGLAKANPTAQPLAVNNPAESAPAEKPEGPLPAIKFEEELHDFGTIKDGDVVEHVFSFVNDGEAPLIISDAKATCGCTVPEWPKEPIPVGGSGEIKVRFNSKNKPGVQNKTVTLTANTWPTTQRVRIKANVVKEGE